MPTYPIPVRAFDAEHSSTLIVCEACDALAEIEPDELRSEGYYACPRGCGGAATYKYEQADECPNCEKLGWFAPELKGACSRPCMLQVEYAAELAAGET